MVVGYAPVSAMGYENHERTCSVSQAHEWMSIPIADAFMYDNEEVLPSLPRSALKTMPSELVDTVVLPDQQLS